MRKIALLLLALFTSPAYAGVSCSVPFNLQNGNTADATQVMANYNAILACFGNAAGAGVNVDITALTALSTPLTPSQGGTTVYVGGTSTGTANVQIVGVVTPASFALTAGNQVTFIAGTTNTGATTINVASTGATNVYRRSQLGITPTVGGEIVAGQSVTVIFDGSQFQLTSAGPYLVGKGEDFFGTTAPAGYHFADGTCQLRVGIFADLFSIIGGRYDPTGSVCDVAHFAMPDGRGRAFFGQDTMGGGAASRITVAGSGCDGSVLGVAGCGGQNHALSNPELPPYTPSGSVSITDTRAWALSNAFQATQSGGSFASITNSGGSIPVVVASGSISGGFTGSAQGGTATAFSILPPLQIVTKIIKY